jgi:predicted Zn-dependent protease
MPDLGRTGFMSRWLTRRRLVCLLLVLLAASAAAWWYRNTRPRYRLQRGQEAARDKDFFKAEQYVALLHEAGAEDHSRLLAAEIELQKVHPQLALDQVSFLKEQSPLRTEGLVIAARSYLMLGRRRIALELLQTVLDRQPDHIDAHRWLATIFYDQGDYSRTVPHLQEVARLDSRDAAPHRLIGQIYRDLEEPDEAVAAYQESLRRLRAYRQHHPHPIDEDEVRAELASCLLKQFRDADVIAVLKGVDTPEAIVYRAEAMIALAQESEADSMLDDALARFPGDGGLMRLRGERYRMVGQPAKAADLLEQVIAKDPRDFRSRSQLAQAYEELGRSADAVEQRSKALEAQKLVAEIHDRNKEAMNNPWDPIPRYRLAELSEQMGRKELAKMWREAAEACKFKTP